MTYKPASAYSVIEARDIKTVAIGRTISENSPFYLFTGGTTPMVVYLTGEYAGHSIELDSFRSEPILAIEGVEFEVDDEAIFRPALVQVPVGSLLLDDKGLAIVVSRGDRNGFPDAVTVYLNDDGATQRAKAVFGFKKWKAFKTDSDQRIDVISFESTTVADR